MDRISFNAMLLACAESASVRDEVKRNYYDNLWWPNHVSDYRIRMIIGGLSTRISYNMITSYKSVIDSLIAHTYKGIIESSEYELKQMLYPLGLINLRISFVRSMIEFIQNNRSAILDLNEDDLISLISKNVYGASYKVAQCCVLYLRGYDCGIIPIDDGLKNTLLPCMGFNKEYKGNGNEFLRKELQLLVKNNDLSTIISKAGYDDLTISDYKNATWWTHLVLIYFKRLYCNSKKIFTCPLFTQGYCNYPVCRKYENNYRSN